MFTENNSANDQRQFTQKLLNCRFWSHQGLLFFGLNGKNRLLLVFRYFEKPYGECSWLGLGHM